LRLDLPERALVGCNFLGNRRHENDVLVAWTK
jgi:hypothetical protein